MLIVCGDRIVILFKLWSRGVVERRGGYMMRILGLRAVGRMNILVGGLWCIQPKMNSVLDDAKLSIQYILQIYSATYLVPDQRVKI